MAWRPLNETQENIQTEQAAADTISQAWQVKVTKLSEALYGIDWAFSRDNAVVAFAEFKARSKKFDTMLLGYAKYAKLYNLHRNTNLPVLLIVQWPDGIWYWSVPGAPISNIKMGGNSRGQNGDTEPIVYIPVKDFKRIRND